MTAIVWLDESDVIKIHRRLLALDGGASGLRDAGLLQSAVARPLQLHHYSENPSIIDLAASYIMGLVKNHAFVDGNKRVGFGVGILFLELNGYEFNANAIEAANIILAVASSEISEAQLVGFLRNNAVKKCNNPF